MRISGLRPLCKGLLVVSWSHGKYVHLSCFQLGQRQDGCLIRKLYEILNGYVIWSCACRCNPCQCLTFVITHLILWSPNLIRDLIESMLVDQTRILRWFIIYMHVVALYEWVSLQIQWSEFGNLLPERNDRCKPRVLLDQVMGYFISWFQIDIICSSLDLHDLVMGLNIHYPIH